MDQKPNYYSRNREARKEYQRQYYINNRDRIISKRKIEKDKHPDRWEARKKYNQEYYKKNKERILARRKEAYDAKKKLNRVGRKAIEFMRQTMVKKGEDVKLAEFKTLNDIIQKNLSP